MVRQFEIEPGEFRLKVGGSSDNLPLEASFVVADGARKPDLLISNIRTVPRYPVQRDSVLFLATVKNQGAGPVSAGTPVKVSFRINGSEVAWSDTSTAALLPGGMTLFCANRGPSGMDFWKADTTGAFVMQAVVDPANAIDECVETNDTASASLEVIPRPPRNLALRRPVTVSSTEGTGYEGSKAVDGNAGSRWSSAFSDPQTITVDLGAEYMIDRVILRWETAYGKEYTIQLSDNNQLWSIASYEPNGDGGNDTIALGKTGRYVKLFGIKRGTQYGCSLYEFEVYGSLVTSVELAGNILPSRCELLENYPNPFNPLTVIKYTIGGNRGEGLGVRDVSLIVYDVLGREVAVLVNERKAPGNYEVSFDGSGLASGVYIYRMTTGTFVQSRKMLLVR